MSDATKEKGEVESIEVPYDEEAIISWLEANLEYSGTEFPMNLIEDFKGTGEMEWVVERAERRMLEICAERLRKFNTSKRAVEWFRDYHGLNGQAVRSE